MPRYKLKLVIDGIILTFIFDQSAGGPPTVMGQVSTTHSRTRLPPPRLMTAEPPTGQASTDIEEAKSVQDASSDACCKSLTNVVVKFHQQYWGYVICIVTRCNTCFKKIMTNRTVGAIGKSNLRKCKHLDSTSEVSGTFDPSRKYTPSNLQGT